ncbi:GDSL-type esterase/lipase family protein [uncultured Tistrella sp.]|uniref:SGNH/GDSL hydrolase family protein n=1 Tax=Tistrella mobilis TaxID=171437 RepID=UPI002609F8DB|nr:GDSL-type esterase/lipase family protein [uncultured Tistrella sp.]
MTRLLHHVLRLLAVTAAMLLPGLAAVPPAALAAEAAVTPKRAPEQDAGSFGLALDTSIDGVCRVPEDGPDLAGDLPVTDEKLEEGRPLVVLAIGSSSTQGYGAPRPEASYPFRLERDLARRYPESRIRVINAGVGGEIAADQLTRLDELLAENDPDLVIWQAGTNDALRAVDRARFTDQLREGLEMIRESGADALLMDLQLYPGAKDPGTYAAFVTLMHQVAEETHTPIYSRYALMTAWEEDRAHPTPDLLFTDRFHLNALGYACISRALAAAIAHTVDEDEAAPAGPGRVQTAATASAGAAAGAQRAASEPAR